MKKMGKRYYIIILVAAIAAGILIREYNSITFEITKSSTAAAPEADFVSEEENGRININTAGLRVLETLDGIGEKMAERIIKYRTKNGKFEVIEDIMKVDGIGEKKFENIKDYITVE